MSQKADDVELTPQAKKEPSAIDEESNLGHQNTNAHAAQQVEEAAAVAPPNESQASIHDADGDNNSAFVSQSENESRAQQETNVHAVQQAKESLASDHDADRDSAVELIPAPKKAPSAIDEESKLGQ